MLTDFQKANVSREHWPGKLVKRRSISTASNLFLAILSAEKQFRTNDFVVAHCHRLVSVLSALYQLKWTCSLIEMLARIVEMKTIRRYGTGCVESYFCTARLEWLSDLCSLPILWWILLHSYIYGWGYRYFWMHSWIRWETCHVSGKASPRNFFRRNEKVFIFRNQPTTAAELCRLSSSTDSQC